MLAPARIFYSYCRSDEWARDSLRSALRKLVDSHQVEELIDLNLPPGTEWRAELLRRLGQADLVVVLVSPSYLLSKECLWEMNCALARNRSENIGALPIVLEGEQWKKTGLSKFEALPKGGRPILRTPEAWAQVARDVAALVPRLQLERFYRELGAEGREALRAGTVTQVPYLDELTRDNRLGLTFIVRPAHAVVSLLMRTMAKLADSSKHFHYGEDRLHFTILPLVTAMDGFERDPHRIKAYEDIARRVLGQFNEFQVEFRGIIATKDSLLVCGFPTDDTLQRIREDLKLEIDKQKLPRDERSSSRGCYMTTARLRLLSNYKPTLKSLSELKRVDLGSMTVTSVDLVVNDFCMSPGKVEVMASIPLGTQAPECRHNLPALPEHVFGREGELQQVLQLLDDKVRPVILASGFAGIGKSTLANYVAHDCLKRRMFDLIVWIDVRAYGSGLDLTLDFALDTIVNVAEVGNEIPAAAKREEKQAKVRQLLARTRALIIFDNYEDLQRAGPDEERMIVSFISGLPLSPVRSGCHACLCVLVTTRAITNALSALRGNDVSLTRIPLGHAKAVMRAIPGKSAKLAPEQYRKVWERMAGLPKYLELAEMQLRKLDFAAWEKMTSEMSLPSPSANQLSDDIFGLSWKQATDPMRCLLLSMAFFSGSASSAALKATSGLEDVEFGTLVISDVHGYFTLTGDRYATHPLVFAFCLSMLNRETWRNFRECATQRFLGYFAELAQSTANPTTEIRERVVAEVRNLLAAVRLATEQEMWTDVVKFHKPLCDWLRTWGHWREYLEISQAAVHAYRCLGQEAKVAKTLVDDIAWVYLRYERIDEAERYANSGLAIYRALDDREGVAQAIRHLGKASLIKGLDGVYKPMPNAIDFFDAAQTLFDESLARRQQMNLAGVEQREKIADMYLDFGRLRWLRGLALEQLDPTAAWEAYETSNTDTQRATKIFEELGVKRGIAKGLGNRGNTTKAMARFKHAQGAGDDALSLMREAGRFYEDSLDLAKLINRLDEIAHAQWGLSEVKEFLALHLPLTSLDAQREGLRRALRLAESSHQTYRLLGGPKDIAATEALCQRLRDSSSANGLGAEPIEDDR